MEANDAGGERIAQSTRQSRVGLTGHLARELWTGQLGTNQCNTVYDWRDRLYPQPAPG